MTGRRAAFIFIFITVALDMLAIGLIIPVLPKLIEHFTGDTVHAAEWVGIFGVTWATTQFLFQPLVGGLSDRYGRRPVVLLSNLGLGLDYVVMALAPSLSWLFLGRILSGVTSASISTAGAYIADVSPPEKRAQNFGMLGAAFGLGFIIGPALGGVLGSYDLRLPFYAAAAMSLVNFCYGFFVLPESLAPENRSPLRLSRANPLGALAFLGRHEELLGLAAVNFLSQLAHTSLPAIYVLYASYRYGWGPWQVGLVLAGVGVATMVVQGALVKPIVKAVGERNAVILGLLCGAAGIAWYGTAWRGSLVWLGIPVAAFWGIFGAALSSILTKRVKADEQGKLQGAVSSVQAVSGIIGPGLFAWVFARGIDPALGLMQPGIGFWLAGALLLAAAGLAVYVTRNV